MDRATPCRSYQLHAYAYELTDIFRPFSSRHFAALGKLKFQRTACPYP
jgi:hypothetical protein